ncbi:hypothetical protein V8E51_009276 [Hyaloscypha variabilis]|uniref:Uncharacterized protein n=1 Tax=Hyaloscypha variabilis (strain UAMH 11265 / GT02V1 / F) TaxID=1149755 RepID=A0A2J6S6B0_HYAVF|nr:hypothetical protein L207DRAFT_577172 [Hyaloscypha variabilis F]
MPTSDCTPPVALSSLSSTTLHTDTAHDRPHSEPPSYPSSLYGADYWIPPTIEEHPDKRRICYRPKYIFAFIGMGVITMAMVLGVVFATLRKRPTT